MSLLQALSDLQLVGSETAAPQGQSTGNGEEHAGAASAGGGQKATKAMKRREKAQREEVCVHVCMCACVVVGLVVPGDKE